MWGTASIKQEKHSAKHCRLSRLGGAAIQSHEKKRSCAFFDKPDEDVENGFRNLYDEDRGEMTQSSFSMNNTEQTAVSF